MAPPPPGSPEPPLPVRAGIGAFVATVVLGLVASLALVLDWDAILADAIAQAGLGLTGIERDTAQEVAELLLRFGLVLSVGFTAVYLLTLWFAWRGHNWARVALWVIGGLHVFSWLSTVDVLTGERGFVVTLIAFQMLAVMAGIVLLALQPSNEWYRYMRWMRTYGRHR